MMEHTPHTVRDWLLVLCGAVAFYCGLQNLPALARAGQWLLGILSPFLLGGAIAFILNVPMRAMERRLFSPRWQAKACCRPIALVLTLIVVLWVGTLAACVIAPGVREAFSAALEQLPGAWAHLQELESQAATVWPQIAELANQLHLDWHSLSQSLTALAKTWGAGLLTSGGGLVGSVISGVSTFVIGLVFAIYLLLQKETLARQGRQVLYALLPDRGADTVLRVLRLAERTFSGFLSGQCLEAVILGCLFAVSMTILRLPYALLVGVLISVTALVPIVGAFVGCAVGALLIATISTVQALLFVALFLILQQVEGNLIYPHVVGSSVGLPSIWVLAAVTLGGSLMGILGMLLFIPLCSVAYALFREFIKNRLADRRIPAEKWK